MSIVQEFKDFAIKGNAFDLAVGVIIGGAFGKIVTSLVNDLISPLLGLIAGNVDLTGLTITLRAAAAGRAAITLNYGSFLQNSIDFLLIALVIFFMVKAINHARPKKTDAPAAPPRSEQLLQEIRDLLAKK